MSDNVISPPEFKPPKKDPKREEQLSLGLESEIAERRRLGEHATILLEEVVALETERHLITEKLATKEAELATKEAQLAEKEAQVDLWKSKAREWSAKVRERRAHYRRERRTNRLLRYAVIFFAISFLIASMTIVYLIKLST